MRKIGMNVFLRYTDDAYVSYMKELGFEAAFTASVKDPAEQARIADLFARHGLSYDFLHAPFTLINDMWLDNENGEIMLADLLESVDRCSEVGVPVDVIHLSAKDTPPSVSDIGRRRYHTLVDYAAKKGVKLAFENLRKLYNVAWAMEEFRDADHVGFCWDCGHENCFTKNVEFMTLYGDRLLCTHIHDNRGLQGLDDHMIPFDGNLNFNRFAEHIRASGYQGALMMEIAERMPCYEEMSREAYLERAAAAGKRLRALTDGNE
ncbi:MAG: sugar phosphate isomerase/epimerase [Clostridia bacterium]|nr:sugar phosphate isomerase/epimerase [Clostridia bacterium]